MAYYECWGWEKGRRQSTGNISFSFLRHTRSRKVKCLFRSLGVRRIHPDGEWIMYGRVERSCRAVNLMLQKTFSVFFWKVKSCLGLTNEEYIMMKNACECFCLFSQKVHNEKRGQRKISALNNYCESVIIKLFNWALCYLQKPSRGILSFVSSRYSKDSVLCMKTILLISDALIDLILLK